MLQDWIDAIDLKPPVVWANGSAPLGSALNMALESVESETRALRAAGFVYARPLICMNTAGQTSNPDAWLTAVAGCSLAISDWNVKLFAIGPEGADRSVLGHVAGAVVLPLKDIALRECFRWWIGTAVSAGWVTSTGAEVGLAQPPCSIAIPH